MDLLVGEPLRLRDEEVGQRGVDQTVASKDVEGAVDAQEAVQPCEHGQDEEVEEPDPLDDEGGRCGLDLESK